MQRVSLLLPAWADRTRSVDGKSNSNTGGSALGRVFGWADRTAASRASVPPASTTTTPPPQTQLAQSKFGREAYWPSSLEKECEKAARILKSFCTDGFLSPETEGDASPVDSATTGPKPKPTSAGRASTTSQTQILKKIPSRIVQNAVGLAIFSCMRSGLWMSGSGGSGILIARKADGTWSTPSGILLHTAALGFVIGVDIYDCVLVINSVAALEMFTRSRVTLGADVLLTVGPVAPMGLLENDSPKWKDLDNTVLTYLKARGQHRAVKLDGSLVTERGNENEKFYGTDVEILDILAGNVKRSVPEIAPLFEAIKAAEGRSDYDMRTMQSLAQQPAPGDATIETPTVTPVSPTKSAFGLPSADDPDPFGVIALEMAGLEIREAGSKHRPTSTQLDYPQSPTSPLFSNFNRQSVDTYLSQSNRGSYMSNRTQATTMTDAYTQTDVGESTSTSPCPAQEGDDNQSASPESLAVVAEPEEIDYTKIDLSSLEGLNRRSFDAAPVMPTPPAPSTVTVISQSQTPTQTPKAREIQREQADAGSSTDDGPASSFVSEDEEDRDGDADDEDDEDEDEEPIIFEVATAAQPARTAIMATQVTQVISAKGALVTIPKRVAPALPARNPARASRVGRSDYNGDVSGLRSPIMPSFDSGGRSGEERCPSVAEEASRDDETTPTATQSHHRNSSLVYTAIQEIPVTPMTPVPLEPCSSADDDSVREPQTPRLGDDIRAKRATYNGRDQNQDTDGTQNDTKLKSNAFNPATIEVV